MRPSTGWGGAQWNADRVYRLLRKAGRHVTEVSRDEAWGREPRASSTFTVLYVPQGWDGDAPSGMPVWERPGPEAASAVLAFLIRTLRVNLLGRILIPDPSVLDDPVELSLLIGEAGAADTELVVAGEVVTADESDVLAEAAAVAARFHRALRYHDSCTVTLDKEALIVSELMSGVPNVGTPTDRWRAQYLARLAIEPPSGYGNWSPSAVRRYRT